MDMDNRNDEEMMEELWICEIGIIPGLMMLNGQIYIRNRRPGRFESILRIQPDSCPVQRSD